MRINNNISALNAWRNLTFTDMAMGKNLEKLSSGLRINRAADDAAGLAISEQMRGQIRGLNQAVRNAQDGISLIQTAEGALTESHAILQRMRELAVQASNDTYTLEDRQKLQAEVSDLIAELDRIANTTQFNSRALLDGTYGRNITGTASDLSKTEITEVNNMVQAGIINVEFGSDLAEGHYTIQIEEAGGGGAPFTVTIEHSDLDGNPVETYTATIANAPGSGQVLIPTFTNAGGDELDIKVTFNDDIAALDDGAGNAVEFFTLQGSGGKLHVGANSDESIDIAIASMNAATLGVADIRIDTSQQDANNAIDLINVALTKVSEERANLGAKQNRLEHTIANLSVAAENLSAAESRIRDVDMAQEMTKFTRNQILLQAGTAMLAQANMAPQSVLQLLR